jgi:hypothetical protein
MLSVVGEEAKMKRTGQRLYSIVGFLAPPNNLGKDEFH